MLILVDVLESIDFGRGEDSFDTEEGEGEGDVESDLVIDPFPATLPTLGIVDDGGLPFETSGMLDLFDGTFNEFFSMTIMQFSSCTDASSNKLIIISRGSISNKQH